jgi:hypothetical protein
MSSAAKAPNVPQMAHSSLIARHRLDSVCQQVWLDTIAGRYEGALYVTIMSQCSFERLRKALPTEPASARPLRVLTLDPNLDRAAIEALGRHLVEHRNAPEGAVKQVREAALQWLALARESKYAAFLRLKSYNSSPTLQGILVPDQFVLVELLPYDTFKENRPAIFIRQTDDEENYSTFAKAFETLWAQSSPLVFGESVDASSQYTQAYHELRRYRDFELAAAGWFAALQIGLATVVWRDPAGMVKVLGKSDIAQFLLPVLVYLLGFSGILSVCYSKSRYEQLVQAMLGRFPDAYEWPRLPPSRKLAQPFFWIVGVLGFLPVVHVFLLGLALGWSTLVCALSVSSSLLHSCFLGHSG